MIRQQEFVMSDGVRLTADVGGPDGAPTVILAHGGGQTRHSWAKVMKVLIEHGYRVLNYDARGHGDSQWSPDNRYPTSRRWEDMARLISECPGDVSIVGASMGGSTALHGVGQGARPTTLVLVDIVPDANKEGVDRIVAFMRAGADGYASMDEVADAVAAYNPHRPRSNGVQGLKKNLRLRSDGRWYWHWDPGMLMIDVDAEREKMRRNMDRIGRLETLPLLVVRGRESDVVSADSVEQLRRGFPLLEVAEIPGAGHMVAGDSNDAFNSAIVKFLLRQTPP